MNVLGVFLLCYLVTYRFLKWISLDGNLSECKGNVLHENNNQSTITTITYGAQELIALKNKQSRISPSTCLLLRKYKILQRRKRRQRGKQGGKKKILEKQNIVCHQNLATFREEYGDHIPINRFTAITLNCRSTLSKEILIIQYMR